MIVILALATGAIAVIALVGYTVLAAASHADDVMHRDNILDV